MPYPLVDRCKRRGIAENDGQSRRREVPPLEVNIFRKRCLLLEVKIFGPEIKTR